MPDGDKQGIKIPFHVNSSGIANSANIFLKINHDFSGQVQAKFISPNGRIFTVRSAATGGNAPFREETILLKELQLEQAQGIWYVQIFDIFRGFQGEILEVGMKLGVAP